MAHGKIDKLEGPRFEPVQKVAFNDGGLLAPKKKQKNAEQMAVVAYNYSNAQSVPPPKLSNGQPNSIMTT